MKDFNIAAVQMNSLLGEKPTNLADHRKYVKTASSRKCKLVLFPELSVTGHLVHKSVIHQAEQVPGGDSCQYIAKLAKEHHIYIGFGIPEMANGAVYNSYVIFGPDGYAGHQRKVHASGDEYYFYRSGSSFRILDLPFCRIGISICFDSMFPETSRVLTLSGAELIVAPHAARWDKVPSGRKAEMDLVRKLGNEAIKVGSVRADDNRCFYVYCNQAGVSGKVDRNPVFHAGGVFIFDPRGKLMAKSRSRTIKPEMVTARLSAKKMLEARGAACSPLVMRKPSAYEIITDQ